MGVTPNYRIGFSWNEDTDRGSTFYLAHKPSKNNPRRHAFGTVFVRHAKFTPNFIGSFNYHPSEFRKDDATTLFTEHPPEITGVETHPEMKPHMVTLLSMAHKDHGTMEVDPDLSKHSSRIAKHSVELGLVTPPQKNRDMKVTNNEDFSFIAKAKEKRIKRWGPLPLGETDVLRAKQHTREILLSRKAANHMGPQFDPAQHMDQLPGMEDL